MSKRLHNTIRKKTIKLHETRIPPSTTANLEWKHQKSCQAHESIQKLFPEPYEPHPKDLEILLNTQLLGSNQKEQNIVRKL